ncbi:peroxiredoxin [Martelella endophytica]|uniref:Glutathione-dependent peroxiredoxin n=1 Tax=Martelella endophytica TaxID=1486262 RepID=A0A0D5LVY4_MAREN|nr:peroxiredoxin [Martelella endophytica]AJY48191.1 alkyl hydroperoxide reductase [Martelella endophytica]
MSIAKGDTLPSATFRELTENGPEKVSTDDIFKGKKVVLFAVPGAFTPTCSINHLPTYLENRDAILSRGVDEIAVVAVNDAFVMGGWAKATGGEGKIRYLSDADGSFTKALGMELDLSGGGLGERSKRYSMLVDNGVVKELNVEENSGQATVSAAATILGQL